MNPLLAVGLFTGLAKLILDHAEDNAREVNFDYRRSGRRCGPTTLKIRNAIDAVLHQHQYAKIGKTVRPAQRLQSTDYRAYHTMYIVYETTSEANIKHYESHFIGKYRDRLDNKHENSTGRVATATVKGKHYLYVVVAD